MSTPSPVLTTIILNWNRRDLLARTLFSYLSTVTVSYELYVIDNCSTDGSIELIEEFCAQYPDISLVRLEANRGAEPINDIVKRTKGDLIHISENDIEYLPGWSEAVVSTFAAFPKLGQLSLFGPVPTDDEIWEIKPCRLIHSREHIVYEASGNVGTTSVIPRFVWADNLCIGNIQNEANDLLLPNDAKLSSDIKQLGYFVAWPDHYLVRNLGHTLEEFEKRQNYYEQGYEAKHWLKREGWQQRINQWKAMPKPIRRSMLFPNSKISPEKSAARADCPQPQLWSMFDGWTGELETIEFIHALVRLIKPEYCIETGTWLGHCALAIGQALLENGRGRLDTIEYDQEVAAISRDRLAHMSSNVEVITISSLDFRPRQDVDFLLLDSSLSIRTGEFDLYRQHLNEGALVLFHDTRINDFELESKVRPYILAGVLSAISLATPRGLLVCQYHDIRFYTLRLSFSKLLVSSACWLRNRKK